MSSGQPVAPTQGLGYSGMFQHRISNQDYLVPTLPLLPTTEQGSGPCFLGYKVGLLDRMVSNDVLTPTIYRACTVLGIVIRALPALPCIILTTNPPSMRVLCLLLDQLEMVPTRYSPGLC